MKRTTSETGRACEVSSVRARMRRTVHTTAHPNPQARSTARGFTLLELMVVLLILVLAATAFPLAIDHTLPGRRVSVAAEKVRSALLDAELRSMASGQPIELAVGALKHSMRSHVDLKLAAPDGATLDSVTLFPDGSSSGAHLTLTSGRHRSSVELSAVTGLISVETSTSLVN